MPRRPIRIPSGLGQHMDPGVILHDLDPAACCDGTVPFRCSMFCVIPASRTRTDRHAPSECWFIAQGRGVLSSDTGEELVQAGDAFLFDSGVGHCIENTGTQPLLVISIWWPP